MGLRPEHLREALLVNADSRAKPLAAITELVNLLLAGKANPDCQQFFAGARLCALQKGAHDVRPITVGETIRRLASKGACAAVKSKARSLFQGQQFGVATAAGSERIIHLCRRTMAAHADDPDFALAKIDLSNAFNNVSRTAFLSLTLQHFPDLYNWVEWCYETESYLTYGSQTIPSAEGVQQGDPLGPLLFSLVIQYLATSVINELPEELPLHVWYLDDGVLAGKASLIRRALDVIAHEGKQFGLFLNSTKCEIVLSSSSASSATLFPDIPSARIHLDGNFDILGSPVGSEPHCYEFLSKQALEPAQASLRAIKKVTDPQVALSLIRQCSGFYQLVFSLRTTPPLFLSELCSRLDASVLQALEDAICTLNPCSRAQAQRKKRHGGFGLHSTSLHACAAYVTSVAFAAQQDHWGPAEADGFCEAASRVNFLAGSPIINSVTGQLLQPSDPDLPSIGPKSPRQHDLTKAIAAHEFHLAYNVADAHKRVRWISQSGEGASNWLFALPSKEMGYAFTPTEFRALARWWLGADVYHESRPCPMDKCPQPLGTDGSHSLVCKSGYGLISRHNALAEHFCDVCSKAHLAPQREKSLENYSPGGGLTRPADIFLPNFGLATSPVLDFCVTHVQQTNYTDMVRGANVGKAGCFAERYASEHKSSERLEAESAGHKFTAMAVESFGSWSDSAMGILRQVALQHPREPSLASKLPFGS